MNGIIGFTTLLLEADPTAQRAKQLRLLADAGIALLKIINDILDLSRIEAGKIDRKRRSSVRSPSSMEPCP